MKFLVGLALFLIIGLVGVGHNVMAAELVTGFVVDAKTGVALPSQKQPYTALTLFKLNPESGFLEKIKSTDCGKRDLCVEESGLFMIQEALKSGSYLLEITAESYFLQRRKIKVDADGKPEPALIVMPLTISPIKTELKDLPSFIPSEGGELSWGLLLTNVSEKEISVEICFFLISPAKTSDFTAFQVERRSRRIGPAQKITDAFSVKIPAKIPDGFNIVGLINIIESDDPFSVLEKKIFYIRKGPTK